MREAGGGGDLGHGEVVLREKKPGVLDAALDDVLVDRHAHGLTEEGLEVRRAETGDGGDLVEGEVFGELVFDEGEDLFEAVAGEGCGGDACGGRERAVLAEQARGHRDDEALGVEASRGTTCVDFAMDGVGDELELGIAGLKAVADLDAGGVVTGLLGQGVDEGLGQAEDEVAVVVIVRDPSAGSVGGDDVDVAVNGSAVVLPAVTAAGELCGGTDVNAEDGAVDAGEIERADGVLTQLQDDAVGGLGLAEDLRRLQRQIASGWLLCRHVDSFAGLEDVEKGL